MTHAAWGSIETTTIAKAHLTLFEYKISETKPTWLGTLSKLPDIRGQSSRYSYSSCQTRNKKVLPDWIQSRISRCSPTNIRRYRSCQRVWSEFYSASPTTRSARCSRMPKWEEWIQMLDNRILWQVFKLILFLLFDFMPWIRINLKYWCSKNWYIKKTCQRVEFWRSYVDREGFSIE